MGCGCRAPALQILAMDLTGAPNLAQGLLASAGPCLQHLQLVIAEAGSAGQLRDGFWSSVRAFPNLAALQLVFLPEPESVLNGSAVDEQVILG